MGCASTSSPPVGEGGLPDPVLFKLFTRAAERRQRPAGRSSAARPTRPARGRGRSRPHARRRAAASVRLRPRHRPPRRHHARLQHRDRRGQPARLPLRRHRARAPVRRGSARRRQRRRARSCGVRAAGAPSRTVAASSRPRPRVRGPTRRSRRCGSRGRRPERAPPRPPRPGAKAFAGPFKDLRARGTLTAGRFQAVTSHRFTPSTIETNWRLERRHGRARLRVDVLMPELGRRERPRRRGPEGRHAPQPPRRRRRAARRASRRFELDEPEQRLHRRPAAAAEGAVARVLDPSRQSSNPDPGPTLAIEIAHGATWRAAASPLGSPFALAARRLREDQLAAAKRGSDLAGLLDLSVRVADRDCGPFR